MVGAGHSLAPEFMPLQGVGARRGEMLGFKARTRYMLGRYSLPLRYISNPMVSFYFKA